MPELVGGALCLDFVNTVDPRHAANRYDYLPNYDSLAAWARHAGALGPAEAKALMEEAKRKPVRAREVLRHALRFREALYELFAGTIKRQPPSRAALDVFNHELQAAFGRSAVALQHRDFVLGWAGDKRELDRVLWPVVHSALVLLTEGPLDRVRECPGPGNCGWLFLDLSRNATRRWCDMRTCGNRVKAHRHYARIRRLSVPR